MGERPYCRCRRGDTCCRCAVWPSRRSFGRLYYASIQPGTTGELAMRCPLYLSAAAPSPSTRPANCFHFSRPSLSPSHCLPPLVCRRRSAFMSAPSAALRNSRGPGVRASSSVTRTSAPTGKKNRPSLERTTDCGLLDRDRQMHFWGRRFLQSLSEVLPSSEACLSSLKMSP